MQLPVILGTTVLITTMNDTRKSKAFFTPGELAAVTFFEMSLGGIGVVTNFAVIVSVLRKLHILFDSPAKFLVLNLVFVDAVISLLAFPRVALTHETGLVILDCFTQFTLLASGGNLLLLVFNRFLSVYDSMKYPSYMIVGTTKRSIVAVFLLPWSAAIFFPILFVVADLHELMYISAVYYTVVILLTTAMDGYMLRKAYHLRETIEKQHNVVTIRQKKSLLEKWQPLLRPIVVRVIFFTSCVSNIVIWFVYPTKADRQSRSFLVHITWSYVLALLNAAINPTVYKITQGNIEVVGTSGFPTDVQKTIGHEFSVNV